MLLPANNFWIFLDLRAGVVSGPGDASISFWAEILYDIKASSIQAQIGTVSTGPGYS